MTIDYYRERKTGPCVPVAVLKCATHGNGFTLYPCGHVPYGRQTKFSAALDAAKGKAWPRDGPGPCWTTQLQRLDELAALLGLEPAPPAALGEKLALLLDVPRLSLIDDTVRLARAVGFEARGIILVATLERASKGRCVLERVLACGALAGLWRPVHLWRTPTRPQCTVFPGRGAPSG